MARIKIGNVKGVPGTDGNGIESTAVTYGVSDSGTTPPESWSENVPAVQGGEYLWTRTVITYTEGEPSTSYSVAYQGADGSALVDSELSDTSENPVQNKVITEELKGKVVEIGEGATAQSGEKGSGISIGVDAQSEILEDFQGNEIIGSEKNSYGVAIGVQAVAKTGAVAVGSFGEELTWSQGDAQSFLNAKTQADKYGVAVGGAAQAGQNGVAAGFNANAGQNGVAVGEGSKAYGNAAISGTSPVARPSIAIGANAKSEGSSNVIIGTNTKAGNSYSRLVAIGCHMDTLAGGANSVMVGDGAYAKQNGVAQGRDAKAQGTNDIAIGYNASVESTTNNCIQLGNSDISALRCSVSTITTSDERDKADITEIDEDKALEFITRIAPIRYVNNKREKYLLRETKELHDVDENGEEIAEVVPDEDGENEKLYRKYGMCEYDREAHTRGDKKGTRGRVGVKAQQVQEVLQDIFGSDNYANIVYDNLYDVKAAGDNPPVESKLEVAYDRLIPFLIGAVQSLSVKVKVLEEQLHGTED